MTIPNRVSTPKFVGALVAFSGGTAALALAGWLFDWPLLNGASPWGIPMNPLTAICVLGACLSLWLQSRESASRSLSRTAQAIAAVVATIGILKLSAVLFGVPFRWDQLIFQSKHPGNYPNQMPPNTAFALLLVGLGILCLDWKWRSGWRPSQLPLGAAIAITFAALIGYFYDAQQLNRIGNQNPMSPNSAAALFLLSAGALLARPDSGPARLLFSRTPGGLIFRRLIPAGVLIPVFLAWLRIEGQRRGYFNLEMGTSYLVLAITALFILLISKVAEDLDAADQGRADAEKALTKSLTRQKHLVDANLIGVVIATKDALITEANAEFLRIIGHSAKDLPIHSDAITPPEWRTRTREAITEIESQGVVSAWEKEYIRKDGTRIPVLVGGAALPGPDGELVAFALDLSSQRKAELKSARTQAFLDAVVENLPNMVFIKDANELRFVRLNQAAEELIGVPRETLLGKNDYDFFPKDQADFFTSKDREVLRSGTLLDIPEEPLATPHGERLLHTKKVPILDEEGEPLFLLGISEDITEQREVQRRLETLHLAVRRHAEQLEIANKELESFSYSVSHDLRAPLRHIAGFADLLLRTCAERLDEVGQRRLRTIVDSAERMGELIDDLLAFSRMGRTEMRRSQVDLDPLVREIVRELETGRDGGPIEWEIHDLPTVSCDPAMLRLALMNLVANAMKYTGTREHPSIEIGAERDADGDIVVHVRDNGVGFNMEYVEKLFGVFQRLHREEEFPGTGIGLANVRRIIHRHGGRTWAEGVVDQGATFYFSLPSQPKEETDGYITADLAGRG